MGEDEARAWLVTTFNVPRETELRLERFVEYLKAENEVQNLVSRPSLAQVWSRHIADSAQLLLHAPAGVGRWIDLGTGAGFPGLVVAMIRPGPVILVEERKKRADFLQRMVVELDLADHTHVAATRAEAADLARAGVISARAFAPLDRLLALGERFATAKTRWVLPKGRNAKSELEAAESSWQGDFRLEPSVTDAEARIIVAEGVRRRPKGKFG